MAALNHAMQQLSSAPSSEEDIWVEVVGALTDGSELHEAAFAQLQGTAQPFRSAIAILAALPQDLRGRSQHTLRAWAAREAASVVARQEKATQLEAIRQEKKAQQAAARQEKKAKREHELALLGLTPQKQQRGMYVCM